MGDGGLLDAEEVVGVDSHRFDCLPSVERVVSTALYAGMRNIIEPSKSWSEGCRIRPARLP